MASVADLGKMVKAKYPGQYDDLDDADLGQKVKAKYPGSYDDFTDPPSATFAGNPARNIRQKNAGRPAQAMESPTISPDEIPGMSPASMVGRGLVQAGQGVQEVGNGQYAKGASDVIRGAGQYAAPFTLPAAVATAPLTTAAGLASGALGSGVGRAAASAMGATPDQADLAGDVSGIAGGAAAGAGVQKAAPYTQRIMDLMKSNPKLAQSAIGLASPRAAHAINIARGVNEALGGTQPAPAAAPPPVQISGTATGPIPQGSIPTGPSPAPSGITFGGSTAGGMPPKVSVMPPPQAEPHPPFAPSRFRPEQAARQQAPVMTPEEMGVHGGVENTPLPEGYTPGSHLSPQALEIARKLKMAMEASQ